MLITKTPFRISFFGGGSDFPQWFEKNGGSVLSSTIDKYCYISARRLPPFFKHKHRVVYSIVENIDDISDINHPVVKAVMNYMNINDGLEIHHFSDLPARSGIGSSSSFTVGLLNALNTLKNKEYSLKKLSDDAIYIEQDVLKENVGCQDQIAVSYGGFNKIDFYSKKDRLEDFSVNPINISPVTKLKLEENLMLFFTGITRISSNIQAEQIKRFKKNERIIKSMCELVDVAINNLTSGSDINDFGRLLDETWRLKSKLSATISSSDIDMTYEHFKRLGAIGGKLLGAGGGGFLLVFANPEYQINIKEFAHTRGFVHVPFKF